MIPATTLVAPGMTVRRDDTIDRAPMLFSVAAIVEGLVWLLPADPGIASPSHTLHIDELRADWTVIHPIDTGNRALVSSTGPTIGILNLGYVADMTPDSALTVAAWLVTLADPLNERFPQVLEAVRSS